jgi:hypothetical protein
VVRKIVDGTVKNNNGRHNAMAKIAEHKAEIMELYDNGDGMSRNDIAKKLTTELGETVTYQDIFRFTKNGASGASTGTGNGGNQGRAKIMIEDPETGEQVARVDWIRQRFEAHGGLENKSARGLVLKELHEIEGQGGVTFQIIYAATRPDAVESEPELDDDGNPVVREKPAKVSKPKAQRAKAATEPADVDSLLEEPNDESLFPDVEDEVEADEPVAQTA